jgi:hypothetical protein
MDRMRALVCICLSATVVAESLLNSALQLVQFKALSGEEALQIEQVCMGELQVLIVNRGLSEIKQPDFTAFLRKYANLRRNTGKFF